MAARRRRTAARRDARGDRAGLARSFDAGVARDRGAAARGARPGADGGVGGGERLPAVATARPVGSDGEGVVSSRRR